MSTTENFAVNAAQQRVLQIVFLLAGREQQGLSQGEIAKAIKSSSTRVHHDLRNLAHAGFAERLANGNWRLAPRVIQISRDCEIGLARVASECEELRNRFSRSNA